MNKTFLQSAAVFGGLGIVLGAFGAHGLERVTSDEKTLHIFQTGVQYQIYHALALLGLAALSDKINHKWAARAGIFFITGIILFSGSLYLLTYFKINLSDAARFAGPVTPVGGMFFIAGWICLFVASTIKRN